MSDDGKPDEGAAIHRLDTRQAELGQDLRRLFEPILDEPVPPGLADLARRLEEKLGAEDDEQEREAPPDTDTGTGAAGGPESAA